MFNVGDRVAIIHLHRVGKERRREAIRIDTVEKVTAKEIVTNKAKFRNSCSLISLRIRTSRQRTM